MKKNYYKKLLLASVILLSAVWVFGQNPPRPPAGGHGQTTNQNSGSQAFKMLNVKFFMEGPFAAGQMGTDLLSSGLLPLSQPFNIPPWNYNGTETVAAFPSHTVDWVLVELRDAATPEQALPATKLPGWPQAMFVDYNGQLRGLDGNLPNIGNISVSQGLFIVIRHRNHVAIMNATGLVLSETVYSYDFSTDIAKAYGGAAGYKELGGGVFGMVAGDTDADGSIFASDFVVWANSSGSMTVYDAADIDFDGSVFASDFVLWAGNSGINYPIEGTPEPAYSSQVPGD